MAEETDLRRSTACRGAPQWWRARSIVTVVVLVVSACSSSDSGAEDVEQRVVGEGVEGVDDLCRDAAATIAALEFPDNTRGMRDVGSDVLYPTLNAETASLIGDVVLPPELRPAAAELSDAILSMVGNMDRFLDEMQRGDTDAALTHLEESSALLDGIDRAAAALGSTTCTSDGLSGAWYGAATALYDAETARVTATGDFAADAQTACDLHADAFMTRDSFVVILTSRGESVDTFAVQEAELGRLIADLRTIDRPSDFGESALAASAFDHLDDALASIATAISGFERTGAYDAVDLHAVITSQELGATNLELLGVECGPYAEVGYFFTDGAGRVDESANTTTTTAATAATTTTTLPTGSGSAANPIPPGDPVSFTATFGDLDGSVWTVRVLGPAVDVTEAVAAEFAAVPALGAPGPGNAFVAVPVALTLESAPVSPVTIGFSLELGLIGAETGAGASQGVDTSCPGSSLGELDTSREVAVGDEVSGVLCLELTIADTASDILVRIGRTSDGPLFLLAG